METAPLKSFATWARTALIREVSARISVVLASQELRQEQPKAVAALEKAVKAAGGGDGGRDPIADKVAYTWFNRIIALRFMDANGYTGIGVVSPERGREGGQPEILSDANRGNIDPDIVSPAIAKTVTGLLNGTRRSPEPLGEAYALLLAEYCRHWNRSMPFMFESEGDYTELLMPANLLADDSVLARAATVLTEGVCQDVEVIGWLYQFYISERKDEVFAGFKKSKKAGAAEIPAATQLFTPHWIVRYLVENSLGRLWLLNRPTSKLADQMAYYVAPVDEETDYLKVAGPEELKVIDPACGSGHMLTYAFDLLYAIYEEDGYAPSDIPGLILANNLYGTEIDPRAGALAAFALTMKARARQRTFFNKQVEPSICVLEPISFTSSELGLLVSQGGDRYAEEVFWNQFEHADNFGSLIRPREELVEALKRHLDTNVPGDVDLFADGLSSRARRVIVQAVYLSQRYDVVVANPPYMNLRNMGARLAEYVKINYSQAGADLFAAFIERALALGVDKAHIAMITMQSWMFGSSFNGLRASILRDSAIRTMAHLGTGAFDTIGGAVVSTTAFAVEKGIARGAAIGSFIDLTRFPDEATKMTALVKAASGRSAPFETSMSTFAAVPSSPIAYWTSEAAVAAFNAHPSLSTKADLKSGISTGDNPRFERQWHEVSRARISPVGVGDAIGAYRWAPCSSGGRFRRWYGNNDVVMDWESDGERIRRHRGSAVRNPSFMGRAGLTYSKIGGSSFAVRFVEAGFVFDDTGRMVFPHSDTDLPAVAALLNSSVGQYFLDVMSPGLSFTSAEIGNIPYAPVDLAPLVELVHRARQISKNDWDSNESSLDFRSSDLVSVDTAALVSECYAGLEANRSEATSELREIERKIDEMLAEAYSLPEVLDIAEDESRVSLGANPLYRFGAGRSPSEYAALARTATMADLVSYAVGCMFGRYSLDEPGLILANQGETLQEYLTRVPSPSLVPDKDNVIPIVDGDWFEDDIVARFRQFLRAAFGDQHFEENLRFVTESLGVKDLRDYFVRSFYRDHVQRYKKRPIYWLFSSSKGSFNALVYMHRYTPSTVSTVLNEYLREFKAKLDASRQHHERLIAGGGTPREMAAAQKEADRLRKVLLELDEYEHDVLYPLATQQVQIDLDDGVKANYPKLGAALKKIPGLEASDE